MDFYIIKWDKQSGLVPVVVQDYINKEVLMQAYVNEEALSLIMTAIEKASYKPGKDIMIALDSAASSFYEKVNTFLQQKRSHKNQLKKW